MAVQKFSPHIFLNHSLPSPLKFSKAAPFPSSFPSPSPYIVNEYLKKYFPKQNKTFFELIGQDTACGISLFIKTDDEKKNVLNCFKLMWFLKYFVLDLSHSDLYTGRIRIKKPICHCNFK